MRGTLNIAAKTRKLDVDNRLSIKLYYRTADNLLKQASIYREEKNVIDLYILLLRFSSLVSETIPEHRDYRLHGAANAEYRKKMFEVIPELEALKPEVRKQVDLINNAYQKSSSLSYNTSSDLGVAWPSYPRSHSYGTNDNYKDYMQFGHRSARDLLTRPGDSGSPVFNSSHVEDRLNTLALSIPRPRDETLSKHSFLGPANPWNRKEPSLTQIKVQYPSYIDASPIEIPSLNQSWSAPSQAARLSTSAASLDAVGEPLMWPESGSTVTTDLNLVNLIRQPSPPPVVAPVQTLPAGLDSLDHLHAELRPSDVADPRPGPPHALEDDFAQSKGPKHLHISTKMMEEFMQMAKLNTQQNLETCGVLAGSLKKGIFNVTTLIVPKQEATSDSCQTVNEEEIFESQDKRGLFQLGWIHTHPSQSCFMSSIDLHTHYSYQIMLQEAIAIVMAPTDPSRTYGIFRLADPGGVKVIQQCQKRGFHPHEEPPDGGPIYEHCAHVFMNPNLAFDIIDLR